MQQAHGSASEPSTLQYASCCVILSRGLQARTRFSRSWMCSWRRGIDSLTVVSARDSSITPTERALYVNHSAHQTDDLVSFCSSTGQARTREPEGKWKLQKPQMAHPRKQTVELFHLCAFARLEACSPSWRYGEAPHGGPASVGPRPTTPSSRVGPPPPRRVTCDVPCGKEILPLEAHVGVSCGVGEASDSQKT